MKATWLLLGSVVVMLLGIQTAVVDGNSGENKGAEEIVLSGGTGGEVVFPHRRHQDSLGDCSICHTLFAQKAGSIEEMKASGELKKKQVMNSLCTHCHREKKRAGEKTGPTTCKRCHR